MTIYSINNIYIFCFIFSLFSDLFKVRSMFQEPRVARFDIVFREKRAEEIKKRTKQ